MPPTRTNSVHNVWMAARITFVCTGNICRSPMADVVLRALTAEMPLTDGSKLGDRLVVSSAGTTAWHEGEPMDPRARVALEARGYVDHGHVARPFETAWFDSVDLVVCMDRGHRQTLSGLARGAAGDDRHEDRLVLLRSFDGLHGTGELLRVESPVAPRDVREVGYILFGPVPEGAQLSTVYALGQATLEHQVVVAQCEKVGSIEPLRRRCHTEEEVRLEVLNDPAVGRSRGVVELVDDDDVEVLRCPKVEVATE